VHNDVLIIYGFKKENLLWKFLMLVCNFLPLGGTLSV